MSSTEGLASDKTQSTPLTLELRHELWGRILERLNTGKVFTTQQDF